MAYPGRGVTDDWMLDNFTVWFKNNCPFVGTLYDDVRFEYKGESQRDKYYFGISINDKRYNHRYRIFTARNDYITEVEFDSVKDVRKWINSWHSEVDNPEFGNKKNGKMKR